MQKRQIVFGISLLLMIGFIIPTSSAQDFQVTPIQLKQTNILFNRLEEFEVRDSLNLQALNFQSQLISNLKSKDSLNKVVIVELDEQIFQLDSINYELEIQNDKLCRKNKGLAYYSGGSTVVCLILLLILL